MAERLARTYHERGTYLRGFVSVAKWGILNAYCGGSPLDIVAEMTRTSTISPNERRECIDETCFKGHPLTASGEFPSTSVRYSKQLFRSIRPQYKHAAMRLSDQLDFIIPYMMVAHNEALTPFRKQVDPTEQPTPFSVHPVVATIFVAMYDPNRNQNHIVATLYHDVLEDCPGVELHFPDELFTSDERADIETIVQNVTKNMEVAPRSARVADAYLRAITEGAGSIIVKMADRMHNIISMNGMKPSFRQQYHKETRQLVFGIRDVAEQHGFREAWEMLASLHLCS
jgi:hypothetical protein